jgi:hypothetical protein
MEFNFTVTPDKYQELISQLRRNKPVKPWRPRALSFTLTLPQVK